MTSSEIEALRSIAGLFSPTFFDFCEFVDRAPPAQFPAILHPKQPSQKSLNQAQHLELIRSETAKFGNPKANTFPKTEAG